MRGTRPQTSWRGAHRHLPHLPHTHPFPDSKLSIPMNLLSLKMSLQ